MVAKTPKVAKKKSPLTTVLKGKIEKKTPPLPNTGNNNRFKNFLTQNYLRGLQNVYAITAPKPPGVSQENHNKKVRNFLNHKTTNIPHMLVNKSTFARNLLGRNNLRTLNHMISYNKYPYVVRIIDTKRNIPAVNKFNNRGFNNWVNRNNYVFRTWNDTYGMKTVRGPYGPIKLTNIHLYKLSPENLRKLRVIRRQNTKNTAEFERKQAAAKAANLMNWVRKFNKNELNRLVANNNNTYTLRVNSIPNPPLTKTNMIKAVAALYLINYNLNWPNARAGVNSVHEEYRKDPKRGNVANRIPNAQLVSFLMGLPYNRLRQIHNKLPYYA